MVQHGGIVWWCAELLGFKLGVGFGLGLGLRFGSGFGLGLGLGLQLGRGFISHIMAWHTPLYIYHFTVVHLFYASIYGRVTRGSQPLVCDLTYDMQHLNNHCREVV